MPLFKQCKAEINFVGCTMFQHLFESLNAKFQSIYKWEVKSE